MQVIAAIELAGSELSESPAKSACGSACNVEPVIEWARAVGQFGLIELISDGVVSTD